MTDQEFLIGFMAGKLDGFIIEPTEPPFLPGIIRPAYMKSRDKAATQGLVLLVWPTKTEAELALLARIKRNPSAFKVTCVTPTALELFLRNAKKKPTRCGVWRPNEELVELSWQTQR